METSWYGGPPRDVEAAIAVLREAVASGVNHMDTADFYGPMSRITRRAKRPPLPLAHR
jgi:aryl-alcohol dehydrogenase-like predicted oxidoreductase